VSGVLGRDVEYPRSYDATLLFPIPRSQGRASLGLVEGAALPFHGNDRWHAYEVSWLDLRGKPVVATLTITVPADTPNLVESKSLKLYLNSFNATRFADAAEVRARIAADLSRVAGGLVRVEPGLPPMASGAGSASDDATFLLDAQGKPRVATATFEVPADSTHLVESKSLKLYLNSFNATRFDSDDAVRERIGVDLSNAAGAPVAVSFGLPPIDADSAGVSIDEQAVAIDNYGPPDAALLAADAGEVVEEILTSAVLKSNCPVTGQPDWARVVIAYRGPRMDRAALLRYLVSFRDHAEFHEQCVERIFTDLMARTRPHSLSVEARYTRRGGLDINPWRATPGTPQPLAGRDPRQ
jgi:7-cyano-7-deazaguanine reductase